MHQFAVLKRQKGNDAPMAALANLNLKMLHLLITGQNIGLAP
jgi:hypothetical protein